MTTTTYQIGGATITIAGDGTTPIIPPAIPQVVSMRQARIALLRINKLSSIASAISALPSPQKQEAEITWEYSQEVQRNNGFVSQIAPLLGMSEQDLDNLFIEASKL